jgi:isopentenyl-diphosphate delta-isomerase
MSLRQSRKLDHIAYSLKISDGPQTTGLEDIMLLHNCLPELDVTDIEFSTRVAGLTFSSPLYLNAITGGARDVTEINRQLAIAARTCNIPMAVGSQAAALEDTAVLESFRVVREENPEGLLIANIGGGATVEDACRAVEMINADALQIHLNSAQELAMKEGDRGFRGYAANVKAIAEQIKVPVIAKEVGFGIAKEQAKQLQQLGVSAIDVGGSGGTNFARIETARVTDTQHGFLSSWGISTAASLVEVITAVAQKTDVLASGGLRSPEDAIKALSLGAKAVGLAAPCLQVLLTQGLEALITYLTRFKYELRCVMLLAGAASVEELRHKPVIITGRTEQWLGKRGIDTSLYANR